MADIIAKIHNIQSALPRLGKDGDFDGGQYSYKFLAVDDVIKAVRPLMNEQGVIMTPKVRREDAGDIITVTAEPNGPRVPKHQTHVFLTIDYTFTAVSDGSSVTVTVLGEASDNQDKSIRKAFTSAQKIALIQTFFIETGEPDEHELDSPIGSKGDEATPTPEERKVAAAKRPAYKPDPVKVPPATKEEPGKTDSFRDKIKEEFVKPGKATPADLNERVAAKKEELGVKNTTERVYEAVYNDLVASQ